LSGGTLTKLHPKRCSGSLHGDYLGDVREEGRACRNVFYKMPLILYFIYFLGTPQVTQAINL